jgi:preprotein translocase subunit YajC
MHQLSLFASGDGGGGGGGMIQLLVLLLIPVAMYMLLIRPQRRRMKDQASMQSDLGIGDEVITSSGIYGFITGEEEDRFWLEVDDDVQIRLAKAAIQGKVNTSDEPDTSDADADAADDDDGDDGVGEDDGVADAADGDRTDADDS